MHDIESMPRRVAEFLETMSHGADAEVLSYVPMTGGYSRVMARADVRWPDGSDRPIVLRGDPLPGASMLNTDRNVEWGVLRAVHRSGHVRIPPPLGFDPSGEILGTPCIVMEHVEGPTLQSRLREVDTDLAGCARAWVDALAEVHSVPLSVLQNVLVAPASWDDRLQSMIALWTETEVGLAQRDPVLGFVAAWLAAHRPPEVPLTLVHGDYNPSNALVGADGRLTVLDWEFARIGDPREDLGYYLSYSDSVPPSMISADPDAFLGRYREHTGLTSVQVNMATVGYFALLAGMNIASMIFRAATGMYNGTVSGIMTAYNVNALGYLHSKFLDSCTALGEPLDALRSLASETSIGSAAS